MEKDRQEELYKFISIDKLELDKENPRIAKKDRNKDDYPAPGPEAGAISLSPVI